MGFWLWLRSELTALRQVLGAPHSRRRRRWDLMEEAYGGRARAVRRLADWRLELVARLREGGR